MKKLLALAVIVVLTITAFSYMANLLAAPSKSDKTEIVTIDTERGDATAIQLYDKGFIKSYTGFNIAYFIKGKGKIQPGAYYLSKNMNALKIIDEINEGPDLKEVRVLEGMRKEQIGEKLKEVLGWSNEELEKWNNTYTTKSPEYQEGVYFPDTYLIPVEENGEQIGERMINNFNEKFAPYSSEFAEKNIKWTTAIKLASIIQREAGGSSDMPLISGVLWNRLLENQKLDIDATVQYAKGKVNGTWWSKVSGNDIRNIDSPYNTYKYTGLPPTPISNPGLAAIDAVLNPQDSDCFYYLHDRSRQIHCAKTYEEHLENIERYLN